MFFCSQVEKKHDFFDSGLLYQFCINFRRRRRLSELLNKNERGDDEGVPVSTPEDNHPDSPFFLRKTQPQEENAVFQCGELKMKLNKLKQEVTLLLRFPRDFMMITF